VYSFYFRMEYIALLLVVKGHNTGYLAWLLVVERRLLPCSWSHYIPVWVLQRARRHEQQSSAMYNSARSLMLIHAHSDH
jgi:hypothetical protein